MKFIYILTLSLLVVGCQKDSSTNNNPTNGSYTFSINLDGQNYSWSGGIPSPSEKGQCAYVPTSPATISIAQGTITNMLFTCAGIVPLGTGTYTIDKNSNPNERGLTGTMAAGIEIFTISDNNVVTITINKIANNIYGEVTGTITGSVTILNSKTLSMRVANINGSFKACKMQ